MKSPTNHAYRGQKKRRGDATFTPSPLEPGLNLMTDHVIANPFAPSHKEHFDRYDRGCVAAKAQWNKQKNIPPTLQASTSLHCLMIAFEGDTGAISSDAHLLADALDDAYRSQMGSIKAAKMVPMEIR